MKTLKFRPHHFLCTLCFKGKGYSPHFVKNYTKIVDDLNVDEDQIEIKVVDRTDDICSACPHQEGSICGNGADAEAKVQALDVAHRGALALEVGEVLTWPLARTRIKERIDLSIFHEICKTCSWKSLGVCERVIRDLHKSK